MTTPATPNFSHYPIKTVGIFGGGQLGMMLAQSAIPLGIRCIFLEDSADCPANLYGKVYTSQQFDEFMQSADVYTLEFENTPLNLAKKLEENSILYPSSNALFIAQDRLNEKQLFNQLDIATVPFMAIAKKMDIITAGEKLGFPLVLKTSRGGYDGKGQFVVKDSTQIDQAWKELGQATEIAPLIAEGFINFNRELSIIAVRSRTGEIRYYPLVENKHYQGILAQTTAPATHTETLTQQAQDNIRKLLEHLNYVGILTLELFVTEEGLLANEIAPRVHNSGHWSIEGAVTSQFENHIRAVVGLPLGDTSIVNSSVMLNVVGNYPDLSKILAIDGVYMHHYHKIEREGRKIAHITVMPKNGQQLSQTVNQVIQHLPNKLGL